MNFKQILNIICKRNINKFSRKFNKDQLRQRLTPIQYSVTQECHTERPFTGKYNDHFSIQGYYYCVVCDNKLFKAQQKFESSCGWPSFFDGIENNIKQKEDNSYGMRRIEVQCKDCLSHLGHLFRDGPKPTGLRYCINSASLKYKNEDQIIYMLL